MDRCPVLLVGPPGVGKTASAYAEAKKRKLEVVYIPLAERDPVEIAGAAVPHHESKTVVWYESEAFARARKQPMLIILDELTAASRTQRVAALRWADPSAGLHNDTIVIATANPPEYAAGAGEPLSGPEISRFRVRQVGPEDAIRWLCGQPGEAGLVGRYLRANPREALAPSEAMARAIEAQRPFPTPRGWHRAACEGDDSAYAELVGDAAAAAYLLWREKQDLPDPGAILSGAIAPKDAMPSRPDGVLATATSLAELITASKPPRRYDAAIAWWSAAADAGHAGIIAPELGRILRLGDAKPVRVEVAEGRALEAYASLVRGAA
jgi:hypothetical protein